MWKIPGIEEIYNEYHKQTFFIRNGVYPRTIKNFENLYNDQRKVDHIKYFITFLERNRDTVDWKLYILALAKVLRSSFELKHLGKFGANKIYRDYVKSLQIEKNIKNYNIELSKINYLLEENNMKNEIFIKDIPSYIVYYRDGIIEDLSKITEFVLETGAECSEANPSLKCLTPEYCYVSYLDGEYKEKDVKVRYAQAVEDFGNETNRVKFMKSNPITAVCIYHKGSYNKFRESYEIILKYIEENDYEIIDNPRECYIDGCWNKENEEDYLTEIQFPVNKK
jgi:effector-binding domain-containing protein